MKPKKIMVVDDDEDIRYILTHTLKKMGYEVVSVSNGREAIRAVASQKIHLALVDTEMPDMTVGQAIVEMRNYHPQMSVVLIIGSPGWAHWALLMSAQGCVYKPLRLDEVRLMVERVMGGTGQEEP